MSQVSTGQYSTCVVANKQVRCWESDSVYNRVDEVPDDIVNPQSLINPGRYACAISGGEIRCWGDLNHGMFTDMPVLHNPVSVSGNYSVMCAVEAVESGNRLQCWGHMSDDIVQTCRARWISHSGSP